MKKVSSIFRFLKGKKYYVAGTLLLVFSTALVLSTRSGGNLQTVSLERGDLVRTVRVAGKVVPREKVDLGFEISGTISTVGKNVGDNVNKGDVLVRLASGGIQADLQKAQAELAKLEGSQSYENSITNAKRALTQSILSAYSTSFDAIFSKADQVFLTTKGLDPKLVSVTSNTDLSERVERDRFTMDFLFSDWKKLIGNLYSSTYTQNQLDGTRKYLNQVAIFLADLSAAVNGFETGSLSQSQIETYKAVVQSARDNVSAAAKDLITKENSLAQLVGDVPVQVASVMNLQFQLSKTSLTSPIAGVVSKQEAKVGQAVTAGSSVVSVVSKDNIVETYVPEVSIVGLDMGERANVTLEAYGSEVTFPATVTHIDPAETVRDGVSTYKVELTFVTNDARVRSGMTANITIETLRKSGTNLLPDRAVVKEGAETYVYVLNGGKREKKLVTLGVKDSSGKVEVLSGLSADDKVLLNPD